MFTADQLIAHAVGPVELEDHLAAVLHALLDEPCVVALQASPRRGGETDLGGLVLEPEKEAPVQSARFQYGLRVAHHGRVAADHDL